MRFHSKRDSSSDPIWRPPRDDLQEGKALVKRLRGAQRAGQIADADLDLFLDVLHAPLAQRWLVRSGPLDDDFADALVHTALRALRPI